MTFITLEGPEGSGKSTQLRALAEALRGEGHDVVETREPGGDPQAEELRTLLLDESLSWSPLAEALLMNAARDAHIRRKIEPALRGGKIVLCDRFFDSTVAYQSAVDPDLLAQIHEAVVVRRPDLTILLDVPAETGLERATARGSADRFERKGTRYHEAVRQAFLAIAAAEPERFVVIDARGDIESVRKDIFAAVHARIPSLLGEEDANDPSS